MMISGAPASGKGTQCELIVHKVNIFHCSVSVILVLKYGEFSDSLYIPKQHKSYIALDYY